MGYVWPGKTARRPPSRREHGAGRRRHHARFAVVGLGLAVATGAWLVPGGMAGGAASRTGACPSLARAPQAPAPGPPSPARPASSTGQGQTSHTTVAIVVPAVTIMQLGPTGRPASARTNDGQAPACRDYFVVASDPSAAHVRRATLAEVDELMSAPLARIVTWSAGWHALPVADQPQAAG